jgi:hypothetical protein
VQLARTAGLVKLGVVTVDGSKIRANTSKHKAMSHGRMRQEEQRLEAEIAEILRKMDAVNRAEDEEHGDDDDGGGGLPVEERRPAGDLRRRGHHAWSAFNLRRMMAVAQVIVLHRTFRAACGLTSTSRLAASFDELRSHQIAYQLARSGESWVGLLAALTLERMSPRKSRSCPDRRGDCDHYGWADSSGDLLSEGHRKRRRP